MEKIPTKKSIHATPKLAKEHGKKLVEPNPYLETQKPHDKWWLPRQGKQGGRPRIAPREKKKESKD